MKNKVIFIFITFFSFLFIPRLYGETALSVDDRAKMGEIYSLEKLKKYNQAIPMIDVLHQRYPDNEEVKWTYVRVLGFGKKWQEAATVFDELCAKACKPDMVETYGHILEAQGPNVETLDRMKKMVEQYPQVEKIKPIYAEMLTWNSQTPEGRKALEELSSKSPQDVDILKVLADTAYASKDYPTAQKNYEEIIEKKPSLEVRKKYVEVLLAQKKYTEASGQMDDLLLKSPQDRDLRFQNVQVLSATGKHAEAVQELKSLIEEGFSKKEAMVMLGDELRLLGRDEEAIRVYQSVNKGASDEK